MKQNYEFQHAIRGFLITPIEETMVRLAARILYCKILHKMRPTECTVGVIELAEQCAAGVTFNWSLFLVNELIDEVEQAQEEPRKKFHYS